MDETLRDQTAGDALTLARRINHDLRSPLGAITTTAELLDEILAAEMPQHQALVAPIMDSARHLEKLVKNLTFVLRATYAGSRRNQVVDMDSVIDTVMARVESVRHQAGSSVKFADQWPAVTGDFDCLMGIWENLLVNAITHGGKAISAGWAKAAGRGSLRFWVRDDGSGLSEPQTAEPFPPFETLHSHTGAGGLGLSIVRRLVELMNGRTGYQRLPGGLTEFSFELPSAPLPTSNVPDEGRSAPPDPGQGLRSAVDGGDALGLADGQVHEEGGHQSTVLDALFAFVGLLNADGVLLEVNSAALSAVSLRPEDVIGRPLEKTFWWSCSPATQAQLRDAVALAASGQPVNYESRLRVAPDIFILMDFSLAPLVDDKGHVSHLMLSGFDLTRNLKAERALAESELRFRTMANNMSQFAWMADAKGWIFWYNQRWFDYTGTTLQDMQGWQWRNVHHPDHIDRVVAKFQHCIETGEVWEDTFPLRGVNGEFRWFLSRAIPVHDDSGHVAQWFGTNTDITDQLATEEALRQASQAKDDFIAVLSHELRTPLNPVLLIASEAATRQDLSEAVRADFEVIRRNVEVEARLIDDLLDLTRISRGKLPLVMSNVSADAVILEALANVRGEALAKGVNLKISLDPARTYIEGDDVRLRQVLWNVLRNAVKFTPTKGTVTVTTRNTGAMFQIQVQDTGIGMTPVELERVFEPFSQGDHSMEEGLPRYGGLGLGLAISKMLVEQHGGHILAQSRGRQRGTLIVIELPRSSEVPATTDDVAEEGHVYAGGDAVTAAVNEAPMAILLVEDHDATRHTLAVLLERRGHHVTQAESVSAGYDHAMAGEFDLLMSDIGLPDGRGDELLVRIRETHPALFGIALSGYGMEADIQRSRKAGFALHLTKPVSLQELERALRRVSRWRNASSATSMNTATEG